MDWAKERDAAAGVSVSDISGSRSDEITVRRCTTAVAAFATTAFAIAAFCETAGETPAGGTSAGTRCGERRAASFSPERFSGGGGRRVFEELEGSESRKRDSSADAAIAWLEDVSNEEGWGLINADLSKQ